MGYHLLTGATGLLGSYLLRDLLLAGHRVAVLVRSSKTESARQRIEIQLRRWEQELTKTLPRPVVLESDLSHENLGLDSQALRWVSQNAEAVIHNAASLVFKGDDPDGEPFLSNVEGTGRVLALCRQAGIRKLHHVSTAYVCGLREGRILESEVDVGQTPGNVYEKSKLQAELMVRTAEYLEPATIYRPSIIVGDSENGYTTTFHGFYAPLKLAHTMATKVVRGATAGNLLMASLGLKRGDHKNFVPVNWVSEVIAHIHGQPQFHGKTYHLTSPKPALITEMAMVMQEAVEAYSPLADSNDGGWTCDGDWFEKTFREQMEIYGAYWRDDPVFDVTNTQAAAPHLPCPVLDRETMMNLAKYAIQSNFGRQRRHKFKLDFDVVRHMSGLLEARDSLNGATRLAHLGLQVNGPGGGQWELLVSDGRVLAADDGVSSRATAVFHLNSKTFQQLASRQMTVNQAVRKGHVCIEGNGLTREQLEAVLQAAATHETV